MSVVEYHSGSHTTSEAKHQACKSFRKRFSLYAGIDKMVWWTLGTFTVQYIFLGVYTVDASSINAKVLVHT